MNNNLSRREFITKSSLAVAAGIGSTALTSCVMPTTPHVRRPKPSDRVNLGVVGFGTIAFSTVPNFLADPRVQIVAVADPVSELGNYGYQGESQGGRLVGQRTVERFYAEQQASGAYKGCRVYEDFREMLGREDLDAVYIATPDHWHCAVALHAAKHGKHIYGQKPLSLTIAEGRRMARAVADTGITWQTGAQQRSSVHFRTACELVRNGRLGKLSGIKVGFGSGHKDWSGLAARKEPEPVPRELNWDLWLGPAPKRPYAPALLQLNWRHNFDFSGGYLTDWGAHHLDILQWALGTDDSGPVAIENVKATLPPASDLYNTATAFSFDVVYGNGIRANVSNRNRNGVLFEGENNQTLFVSRGILESKPEELRREKIGPGEIHLYESQLHERNFIDHVYDAKPTISPVEVGHRSITIAHLANIAIRLGRTNLRWDPKTEKIIDDAAANRLLARPMRREYAI
jgi:predicted dehydrogenase